jgi:hypothetical protein
MHLSESEPRNMKTLQSMILAAVAVLGVATGAMAASPERPPATMSVDAKSALFWISTAAATAPDGTVRYEIFPPGVRDIVQAHSAPSARSNATAGPCEQLAIVNNDEPSVRGPFAGDTRANPGIFSGTVTAVTEGFLESVPASLLTVHIDEVLRDAAGVSVLSDVFVPYYVADFTIGGTRFCNAALPRNGVEYVPQVGDRVLVRFSARPVGHYINVQDQQLFFGHADQVYPPRKLLGDRPEVRSFSNLVQRVKAELTQERPKK